MGRIVAQCDALRRPQPVSRVVSNFSRLLELTDTTAIWPVLPLLRPEPTRKKDTP
jgi:hypothetical protein